ncbi:MAG: [protein-PII] uridylyltransferase [Deltaproteobacteria bacterium]|nr:[protein-PII] uridylyltransferase [Deltaproteobacteria bacterium]
MSVALTEVVSRTEEVEILSPLAELEQPPPGGSWAHEEVVARAKIFLERKDALLRRLHAELPLGGALMNANTRLIDTLLRTLMNVAEAGFRAKYTHLEGRLAIIAQGGYGRGKMAPYSDIDVLFLYSYKVDSYVESITEQVLLILWDVGLQVGSAVRTVADCVRMGEADLTIRTSLMDTRYVAGDPLLAAELETRIRKDVIGKNVQDFFRAKLAESEQRHKRYGGSIFVLEPNLKEGMGGLRDYHTALWIAKAVYKVNHLRDLLAKGVMTERELKDFERSIEFMWRVRNELHLLSGRRNDQIQFEYQDPIAKAFRYRTNGRQQPEERFMQHYYLHARNVLECSTRLVQRAALLQGGGGIAPIMARLRQRVIAPGFKIYEGALGLTENDLFEKRPEAMMEAFELAQKHGIDFSSSLLDRLRENLRRIDRNFRQDPEVSRCFLRILDGGKDIYRILTLMNNTRLLGRYIPEFGQVVCKVQRDAFHVYTVDVHSIIGILELEKLEEGGAGDKFEHLRSLVTSLDSRHELYLALLLHDIGKGTGKDHHIRGKLRAHEVCTRMGLTPEATARIEFLVENHLLMVHYAFRRDVNDFRLIADFARRCGDLENLNLLYLVSFADVRAVAPDIWNEWKRSLLELAYQRTHAMLERGRVDLDEEELVVERQAHTRELLAGEIPEEELDRFFSQMVNRFFISIGPQRIARCIRIWRELNGKPFSYDLKQQHKRGTSTLIVCAPDSKGLFSKIAGVMAANNANIVSASVFTTLDGTAIDIYQITDPVTSGPILTEAKWEAIFSDLDRVLSGEEAVAALVARKRPPSKLAERQIPRRPSRVEIDNAASDFYTVIDIDGHDRVGLLYEITNALHALDVGIYVSRITTRRGNVDDVFFVKGPDGKKIDNEEFLEKICHQLLEVMGPSVSGP